MSAANTTTLPQATRDAILALMDAKNIGRAARILGVSRETLRAAAHGLPCQRGTFALLTQKLAERAAQGKTP